MSDYFKVNKLAVYVVLGMTTLVVLRIGAYGCSHVSELARLASCRPHLIAGASKRYARENNGSYPPLSPIYGRLMYDTDAMGKYAFSVADHICEHDAEGPSEGSLTQFQDLKYVDDWSYVYLGYFVENEEQGLALIDAYREVIENKGNFEENLTVPDGMGNGGGTTLHRLTSVDHLPERLTYLKNYADRIPVVVEWPGNHAKEISKVVFLDGHVELMTYPSEFPMTERFITALRELDAETGPYIPK